MGSTVLPKTPADKRLSLKHLNAKIELDRKHRAEHLAQSAGPSDTYNNAHAREHARSEKANLAQKAKVQKKRIKAAEKTAKKTG